MARISLIFIFCLLSSSVIAGGAPRPEVLHIEGDYKSKTWTKIARSEKLSLKWLFNKLERSSTGRALINAARKQAKIQGQTLFDVVKSGETSMTDTTLVRRFSPSEPNKISYESKSLVYLNRELKGLDALLDLAHELTHFAFRHPFNPYQSFPEAHEFISSTIEGEGGEVQAFLVECQVLRDLYPRKAKSRDQCRSVWDASNERYSFHLGTKEFYKVGPFKNEMINDLDAGREPASENLPLQKDTPTFISSAWGLPYPYAALKEYKIIKSKVCENDKKRLELMEKKQRNPAAERQFSTLKRMFLSRCSTSS